MIRQTYKTSICIIVALLMIVAGCSVTDQKEYKRGLIIYQKGLPDKMPNGMKAFLYNYVTYNDTLPRRNSDKHVFASGYVTKAKETTGMAFYELPELEIEEAYKQLKNSDKPAVYFSKLRETTKAERHPVEPKQTKLPEVIWKSNQLYIATNTGNQTIDLNTIDRGKPFSDQLFIHLLNVTDEDMLLDIWDVKQDQNILLFSKLDFTKKLTISNDIKSLDEAFKSGKLDEYRSLLQPLDSKGKYELLAGDSYIFDKEAKKLVQVADHDKISEDGKQVYLNGKSPKEGKQQTQNTAVYLNREDDAKKQFAVDSKIIAKKSGISTSAKLHDLKTMYFSKDFIVLRLDYTSYTADAGGTNVLINLKGKQAKAYIIDLGFYE